MSVNIPVNISSVSGCQCATGSTTQNLVTTNIATASEIILVSQTRYLSVGSVNEPVCNMVRDNSQATGTYSAITFDAPPFANKKTAGPPPVLNTQINLIPANGGTVIYVDRQNNSGTYDGQSWETAYQTMGVAISTVGANGVIYVAEGTYSVGGTSSTISANNVMIRGGYGHISRLQGCSTTPTIFDGGGSISILKYTGANLTLDNIKFINGFTTSTSEHGAVTSTGQLNVYSCQFESNSNGAVYAASCIMENCDFISNGNNDAFGTVSEGGAVRLTGVSKFTNCTFINNRIGGFGGAIACLDAPCTLINCAFNANSAQDAGAIGFRGLSSIIINIVNCSFGGNKSATGGNGPSMRIISSALSTLNINNSILWGGTDGNGNATEIYSDTNINASFGANIIGISSASVVNVTINDTGNGFQHVALSSGPVFDPIHRSVVPNYNNSTVKNLIVGNGSSSSYLSTYPMNDLMCNPRLTFGKIDLGSIQIARMPACP